MQELYRLDGSHLVSAGILKLFVVGWCISGRFYTPIHVVIGLVWMLISKVVIAHTGWVKIEND